MLPRSALLRCVSGLTAPRGLKCREEIVARIFEKAKSSDHVLTEAEIVAEINRPQL
jgi:hypothetical protein